MMDDNLKNIIDDYWLGRLPDAQRSELEQQMEQDPVLKQEVMAQQQIIQGINAFGEQQMKDRLKSIHQQVVSPSSRMKRLRPRYWAAAAAAVLLLAVCAVLFLFSPDQHEQLFADYYQTYQYNTGQRGQEDQAALLALQEAYRQGDYQSVLTTIDQLDNSDEAPLALVKGIAELELNNEAAAADLFRDIIQQNNPLYVDHARWYLALTYLKQDKMEQAKRSLQPLVDDPASDHHVEAKELYERLP